MPKRPWLSVLMPTFNGEAYIGSALASVQRQGDPDVEVLIADDGSSDATLDVVRQFSSTLLVRIVQQKRVGNWVAATNVALRAAHGRYATMLHQDDEWLPGRLATMRRCVERGSARLFVHPAIFIDSVRKRVGTWRCPFHGPLVDSEEFVEHLLVQNSIAIASPIFECTLARSLGGLDESLVYTADWDFWLRMGSAGPVQHVDVPLAAFRLHASSQTADRTRTLAAFRADLEAPLQRHFAEWACRVPHHRARDVARAAQFSIEMNTCLLALHLGTPAPWSRFIVSALRLGIGGARRYAHDSRVLERVVSRCRAGLVRRHAGRGQRTRGMGAEHTATKNS